MAANKVASMVAWMVVRLDLKVPWKVVRMAAALACATVGRWAQWMVVKWGK